jgi:hypothetical protein
MQNVTLEELHRNILDLNVELNRMHTGLLEESRRIAVFCHELDKRLTRAEERILFFCAIAGAVSGLLSNFLSRLF